MRHPFLSEPFKPILNETTKAAPVPKGECGSFRAKVISSDERGPPMRLSDSCAVVVLTVRSRASPDAISLPLPFLFMSKLGSTKRKIASAANLHSGRKGRSDRRDAPDSGGRRARRHVDKLSKIPRKYSDTVRTDKTHCWWNSADNVLGYGMAMAATYTICEDDIKEGQLGFSPSRGRAQ